MASLATLRIPPVWRGRLVLAGVVLAGLFAFYMTWFRDSSLVRVQHVTVTGLSTGDATRVRTALTSEAQGMTTLHVHRDRLERAVQGFAVVRSIEVTTSFPNEMTIHVIERRPAALLRAAGGQAIVAGDGTLLRNVDVQGKLPVVRMKGALPPTRLAEGTPALALAVVAAAPRALAARLSSVRIEGGDGYVGRVRNGPRIIFGSAQLLAEKWAAAASVLADRSSKGATYVDVRLPGRPVAGGLGAQTVAPVAPAGDQAVVPQSQFGAQAAQQTPGQSPTVPARTTPQQPTPAAPAGTGGGAAAPSLGG